MGREKKMKIKENLKEEYEKYVKINQEDEYSKACIDSGEIFGNALDEGKTPEEANEIMCETENGLTGFMASMIMKSLAHFHPRGEEVRVWYNDRNGVKSEKRIVNTAILNQDDNGKFSPEFESV